MKLFLSRFRTGYFGIRADVRFIADSYTSGGR
jgi:hypothetical protein